MKWKFWKRKSDANDRRKPTARGRTENPFARLANPYAQRQLIALQRVAGNQAVLQLLGVRGAERDQSHRER